MGRLSVAAGLPFCLLLQVASDFLRLGMASSPTPPRIWCRRRRMQRDGEPAESAAWRTASSMRSCGDCAAAVGVRSPSVSRRRDSVASVINVL